MTRLYNRETLFVLLVGLAAVLALGWFADMGRVTLMLVAGWLVAALPIAMKVQHGILPIYLRLGFHHRALDLSVDIRESAANRKSRDMASIDLAMIQAAMGRFGEALKSLESIKQESFNDLPQALILANRAWCRAHLGEKLDKALAEGKEARELAPDEDLLSYFEGLVLHKMGQHEKALKAVEKSLAADPDPMLPVPGERAMILGDLLMAQGLSEQASKSWEDAARQAAGKGPFASVIAEKVTAKAS